MDISQVSWVGTDQGSPDKHGGGDPEIDTGIGCCERAGRAGPRRAEAAILSPRPRPGQQPGDGIFSSLNLFSLPSTAGSDGPAAAAPPHADLFASFNPFGSSSGGPGSGGWEWLGMGGGDGALAHSSKASHGPPAMPEEPPAAPPRSDGWNLLSVFQEPEAEEETEWIDMAETLPENLRKLSTGMDVRMMNVQDLTNLHVKIGTRLQEAKEASQCHSGEVDGESVMRSVTVWEINFWEACELSMAHQGALDPEYIHGHLEKYHDRDPVEHPEHWQHENTPARCLLQGIPFVPLNADNDGWAAEADDAISFSRSRQSHGVITLQDPTSKYSQHDFAQVHSRHMADTGHKKLVDTNMTMEQLKHKDEARPHVMSTPAERISAMLSSKGITVADKIAYCNFFAAEHQDWIEVKDKLHSEDPVVVSNYNGQTIHRSDMKRLDVKEINAVMRWRQGELRQRRKLVFRCVGKALPDAYQRCIHRLRHEVQDVIQQKLNQVRKSGSTTLDLKAAAMIIVENGGGYSAAQELNVEMEEPEDLKGVPTPSQLVEMQRTSVMKHFREGKLDAEDVMSTYDMSAFHTGSSRGFSVHDGKSKLDTPAIYSLLKPRSQVDLYQARFLGDEQSLGSVHEYARPEDARSVVSAKVESKVRENFESTLESEVPAGSASRQPVRQYEQSRRQVLETLLSQKFDKRTEAELKAEEEFLGLRLAGLNFHHKHEKEEKKADKDDLTFAQAIPSIQKDPYAYGGIDGQTQEPIIGWEGNQPYINNFNNNAVVTTVSMKRYRNRAS